MKHTQGEWEIHYNKSRMLWEVWPVERGLGRICGITGRNQEEEQANAKLIAAAPKLLLACKVSETCFRKLARLEILKSSKHVLLDNASLIKAAIAAATE